MTSQQISQHAAATQTVRATATPKPVVRSYNEWDPLEEVIVGVAEGSAIPNWDLMLDATMPTESQEFFKRNAGRHFPQEVIDRAKRDLEGFAKLLEREGARVRFPAKVDYARPFSTPDWSSVSGLYSAMPRDLLLVVGEEIIEAPMAWRSRYFEVNAYRSLLTEYFRGGAKWTAVPKPSLIDAQFQFGNNDLLNNGHLAVTELEPTFDAADFARCGKDIFVQRSHVTNVFGIEWMRRHLAPTYNVHEVEVCDSHPMHIDATLVPLAPGKLLANPERLTVIPPLFKNWEVRYAPKPNSSVKRELYLSSAWISMNLVSIDEKRVVVETQETELMALLKNWGFEPIPCDFLGFNALGGSFHCATLDVRRTGELKSYF